MNESLFSEALRYNSVSRLKRRYVDKESHACVRFRLILAGVSAKTNF